MNKIFVVLIVIGVTLILLILSLVLKNNAGVNQAEVANIVTDLNLVTSVVRDDTNDTIQFPSLTNNGNPVPVRDFTRDADVVNWGEDTTFIIGSGVIQEEEAFQIFFYSIDKSISISILQEPIADIRMVAEAKLVERLQIKPEQMCGMNIRVSVPSFVSENLSGVDLGLSFCPDSVSL